MSSRKKCFQHFGARLVKKVSISHKTFLSAHMWHGTKGMWHYYRDVPTSAMTIIRRRGVWSSFECYYIVHACLTLTSDVLPSPQHLPHQCLTLIRPQTEVNCSTYRTPTRQDRKMSLFLLEKKKEEVWNVLLKNVVHVWCTRWSVQKVPSGGKMREFTKARWKTFDLPSLSSSWKK